MHKILRKVVSPNGDHSIDREPYKEHALIDSDKYSKSKTREKAKSLRTKAVKRGYLFKANLDE